LCVISCSSAKQNASKQLDQAEELMSSKPDTALAIIEGINLQKIEDQSITARYALLKSIALDKNYIDIKNDSLILIAEKYYSKKNNHEALMKSLFYHGRVHFNAGQYSKSIIYFTKSLNIALLQKDNFWCGKNAEQLSYVYNATYHGSEEIHYADLCVDYFRKSHSQPFLNYAILGQARAYLNNDKYTIALEKVEEVTDSANKANDKILYYEAQHILARIYFSLPNYPKVIEVLNKLHLETGLDEDATYLLAISYLEIGDIKKATEITKPLTLKNNPFADSFAYKLAAAKHDYKQESIILERLLQENDSILGISLRQNFTKSLSDLYSYDRYISEVKLRNERIIHAVVIIIVISIMIVTIIIFINIYRRQIYTINKNVLVAQNFSEILKLKENQYSMAQTSIRNLFSARYEIVDSLCKTMYEYKSSKVLKTKISNEIESLIEDLSSDKNKISDLENFVNAHYSNIISNFKNDLPNLKDADYLLFLYSILGFSLTAIALFLKEEKLEPIYNRKARLKNKIKQLDSINKDRYLDILS
jgi:hypothetical protein